MARKKPDKRRRKVSQQSSSLATGTVSLLPQYASISAVRRRKDRRAPMVIPITIEDPWPENAPAFLKQPPKKAEEANPEAAEWIVPSKRPIEVLASRRDVIAGMRARGQMDPAMFAAARAYAATYETAMALAVKTIDPAAPVVSGGGNSGTDIEAVLDADTRLARFERRIRKDFGAEAIALLRDVVGSGLTIERAAVKRGDSSRPAVEWLGGTLRRCLQVLAESAGYAVRGAYANREREEDRKERQRKRQERKDRERRGKRNRGKAGG